MPDLLSGESGPLEPHQVQATSPRGRTGHPDKRQTVEVYPGKSRDHSKPADAAELMHRCERRDKRLIAHRHMTSKGRTVGQCYLVAHGAIVGYMGTGHKEILIADAGGVARLSGAVKGDTLPQHVIIADHYVAYARPEREILWIAADHGVFMDLIAAPKMGVALNHRMGPNAAVITDDDLGLDDGIGTDRYSLSKRC
jgi:hypothetical protein